MKTRRILYNFLAAVLSAMLACHADGASAAESWLSFRHINSSNGLAHNTAPSITQDAAGYLWIATHDGLNRYDSQSIKVYRHITGDSLSLPSSKVLRTVTDSAGNLWALTPEALSKYVRETDSFRNFPLPAGTVGADLLPVSDSEILLATDNGLYSFDTATGKTAAADFGPETAGQPVTRLGRDGAALYIGTGKGLWRADPADRKASRVTEAGNYPVNEIYASGGVVWIGTEGDGAYHKEAGENRFGKFTGIPSDARFVRAFRHDNAGRLWIGTFNGLYVWNPADGSRFHIPSISDKADRDISECLNQSSVLTIFRDNQGGMWVGTYYGGIDYTHPLRNQFRSLRRDHSNHRLNDNIVSCMKEAPDGEILIGTNSGGVNIYNPKTNTYRHITTANGLASNDVKSVRAERSSDRIFIGVNHGGLAVADLKTLKISRTLLPGQDIYDMRTAVDSDHLWICAINGLYYADPANGETRQVVADTEGNPVLSDEITDLYRDRQNRLWVSGAKGVTIYREEPGGRLTRLPLLDKFPEIATAHVNAVGQSRSTDETRVSTRDGLFLIAPDFKTARHLTTADGLPNNIVYGALEDRGGNLWISTNRGLSQYDPQSGRFRNYSGADYLPFNQFNPKSYLLTRDGRMYFGGVRGIINFDPANITPNPYSPAPRISGIRLFDKPVKPGDKTGILSGSAESASEIELKPDQSMVAFDFTVCNFANGRSQHFAYRLEGYDKDWLETTGTRSTDYRNLPPGDYTLRVKAANSDGQWSEVTSLKVKVLPRWHQLWWVRLLMLLAGAGIIAALVRHFTRRRLERERLEFERRDIERRQEVNDMKVNFFVNMSHELRTPLTLILLPATELLEQKRNEPKVADKLETIRANTLRILGTINQMLDYQRAENGMFALRVSPQDINLLARQEFAIYRQAAQHHGIDFRLDASVGDGPVCVDPSYISIIIGNLLSNSFKHTPDNRSITLSAALADDGKSLVIRVSDTGEGIAPDKLPHIFERFYKATETGFGSGIGLSLVKRLVELHHGTITVESAVGEGTTFSVTLPAVPEAYSPDETADTRSGNNPPDAAPSYVTPETSPSAYEPDPSDEKTKADGPGKPTILLADDNADIIKYMSEALAPSYRVLTAPNGAEALKTLEVEEVDMVITDVMMPVMDGVQLCKAVKRNLRTSHIPVVMLSAKSDVRDQLEAMKVGADDYLPKPFSMPLLIGKITNRLRTRARAISYYSSSTVIEPAKMALNPLDEEFLTNALKVVEKNLDNSEFTTENFAREMLVSRTNLHMKLKALTGESANEFIRRNRMNRALELLKSGRHTVAEVSAMTGYSTPSYFSTSFKKFFGELPSDFTRQ